MKVCELFHSEFGQCVLSLDPSTLPPAIATATVCLPTRAPVGKKLFDGIRRLAAEVELPDGRGSTTSVGVDGGKHRLRLSFTPALSWTTACQETQTASLLATCDAAVSHTARVAAAFEKALAPVGTDRCEAKKALSRPTPLSALIDAMAGQGMSRPGDTTH